MNGLVHIFLVEAAFVGKTDIAAYLFKQLHTSQCIFQIVNGTAQSRLGNAKTGRGGGVMLCLGQNREIQQIIIVHRKALRIYKFNL